MLKIFYSEEQLYVPCTRTACYYEILKVTPYDLLDKAEIDFSTERTKPQQNYHKLYMKTIIFLLLSDNTDNKINSEMLISHKFYRYGRRKSVIAKLQKILKL